MITILENQPLAPYTSFGIGGPARFFTDVSSLADLHEAILFAKDSGIPFAVLGGGSNVLVSDDGFDGLIVHLKLAGLKVAGDFLRADAGVDLNDLVQVTADCGLTGLESLAGIPGQVGGAVRGNAGAYGRCIGELCERIFALDTATMELIALNRDDCRFRYRSSLFKEDGSLIVVSALLSLWIGDPGEVRQKVEATLARRAARRLQCDKSAGSFFMNPVVNDPELIRKFEAQQHATCRDNRIPAGWLIDQVGLRSAAVGAAVVSAQHANYLVNTGEATAEEVRQLARLIKGRVRAAMGIDLQEEVCCLGFKTAEPPFRAAAEEAAPVP